MNKASKLCRITASDKALLIVTSAAFSFMVFFFSPVVIFLKNQQVIAVPFGRIAVPMLLMAVVSTIVLSILQYLMRLLNRNAGEITARLLFGMILAMSIQALILNRNGLSLTGIDADRYYKLTGTLIMKSVIFFVIMFTPLAVYLVLRSTAGRNSPEKNAPSLEARIAAFASAAIFAAQFFGCTFCILKTDRNKYDKSYNAYLSYEPTMSLSKDDNIVVFLCDRLDSQWMDMVIEKYPDISEKLEGFTFYQNNTSHNTQTFPSIAQMLTAKMYEGEGWRNYIYDAWSGETVPRMLKKNGYNVNLLIDNLNTFNDVSQLKGQCDNIRTCKKDDISYRYFGEGGIVPQMTRVSLSVLAPYGTKRDLFEFGSNPADEFAEISDSLEDKEPGMVDEDSDAKYIAYLKKYGLDAESASPTFSFIHLNFAHVVSDSREKIEKQGLGSKNWRLIRQNFETVFGYLDEMKRLGIYDSSTIILVADHGRPPRELEYEGKDMLDAPILSSLLIKPKNAEARPLVIDHESELSNDFFAASILEYAGIDHEKYGLSYNDVISGGLSPERYMQTGEYRRPGRVFLKTLYKIKGDARDPANWEPQSIKSKKGK